MTVSRPSKRSPGTLQQGTGLKPLPPDPNKAEPRTSEESPTGTAPHPKDPIAEAARVIYVGLRVSRASATAKAQEIDEEAVKQLCKLGANPTRPAVSGVLQSWESRVKDAISPPEPE